MEFNPDRYKVFTWKSLGPALWMLNPLTFLLELGLGQRWPSLTVIDKTLPGPETERTIVPCPHCGKLHDVRTWSWRFDTGFKNWFGLYCRNCGNVIPCLLSISSYIILALTFPVWTWFEKSSRKRWMQLQPARFRNLQQKNRKDPFGNERWVRTGLLIGLFYLIMIGLIQPLIDGDPISWTHLIFIIPVSLIFGLGMSFSRGDSSHGTNH